MPSFRSRAVTQTEARAVGDAQAVHPLSAPLRATELAT